MFHSKTSGMTLLETLIAVVILVSIMALLSIAMFQSQLLDEKLNPVLEERQKMRILHNLIQTDFRSAVYLPRFTFPFTDKKAESGIVGLNIKEGETPVNQIYMHVQEPSRLVDRFDRLVDPELHEISYFLHKNEEDEWFTLYRGEKFYIRALFERVNLSNFDQILNDTLNRRNILLSSRVVSFRIQYLQGKKKNGEDNYLDSWDSKKQPKGGKIPEGIKVELITADTADKEINESFLVIIRPEISGVKWQI